MTSVQNALSERLVSGVAKWPWAKNGPDRLGGTGGRAAIGTVGSLGGAEVLDTLCAIRGPINTRHELASIW
jgi:hypothetical protein